MLERFFKQPSKRNLAQAAVELAIFGTILMFLIGLIFRTGLNASHSMNTQLRAMRFAMAESFKTAEGYYRSGTGNPSGARNTASVFLLEDRLSGDVGMKTGERDRIPYMAMGSGTFTKNLFLPLDLFEYYSLPIYDVIINGQRFPFTVADFRTVRLALGNSAPVGDDGNPIPVCNDNNLGNPVPAVIPAGHPPYGICWEPDCFVHNSTHRGCTIMFRRTYNYAKNREWCDGINIACPASGPRHNLTADQRFDLNFDGTTDISTTDTVPCETPPCVPLRERFGWQWIKVAGVTRALSLSGNMIVPDALGIDPGDTKEATFPSNNSVDVDGDLQEENVYKINAGHNGVINTIQVMDFQSGDLNFDEADKIGLGKEAWMLSYTRPAGTYYRIEEGKLFNVSNGHFARNTTRQDHGDIIWRTFRISNNTGRFCKETAPGSGKYSPRIWGSAAEADWVAAYNLVHMRNPVEVCVPADTGETTCAEDATINKTCMDLTDLHNIVIHVRSRIKDLRGRRWITRFDPQK